MITLDQPKVRTAAVILKNDEVLLGRIIDAHESEGGQWIFPWHEMKLGESYYKSFFNGLWEDIGFRCTNVFLVHSDREHPWAITNDIYSGRQYITLLHRAVYTTKRERLGNKNKDKYEEFRWFKWHGLDECVKEPEKLKKKFDDTPVDLPYPLSNPINKIIRLGRDPFKDLVVPPNISYI